MSKNVVDSVFLGRCEMENFRFLQKELERLITRRTILVDCRQFDLELDGTPALLTIERNAIAVIERIFELFKPEAFEGVRKMEPRVIWEQYWYERHTPWNNSHATFLSTLAQLNQNPLRELR